MQIGVWGRVKLAGNAVLGRVLRPNLSQLTTTERGRSRLEQLSLGIPWISNYQLDAGVPPISSFSPLSTVELPFSPLFSLPKSYYRSWGPRATCNQSFQWPTLVITVRIAPKLYPPTRRSTVTIPSSSKETIYISPTCVPWTVFNVWLFQFAGMRSFISKVFLFVFISIFIEKYFIETRKKLFLTTLQ